MHIYLVRHGQSTGNNRQCFMGWSDHPLTEVGRAQAEATAARLAPAGPLPVLCSDLRRAWETAEAIAACWGAVPQPDPGWREVHCGEFEDRPWADFATDASLAAAFDADPLGTVMPGGESMAMMMARVVAAFTTVIGGAHGCVIVTHDGPIRALLSHCLSIPPARFWTLGTDHGGVTHLTVDAGWISVRTVNDISHLVHLSSAQATGKGAPDDRM